MESAFRFRLELLGLSSDSRLAEWIRYWRRNL